MYWQMKNPFIIHWILAAALIWSPPRWWCSCSFSNIVGTFLEPRLVIVYLRPSFIKRNQNSSKTKLSTNPRWNRWEVGLKVEPRNPMKEADFSPLHQNVVLLVLIQISTTVEMVSRLKKSICLIVQAQPFFLFFFKPRQIGALSFFHFITFEHQRKIPELLHLKQNYWLETVSSVHI